MNAILLPTDFSENSWNAITYALQYFKHLPCNFYLLNIDRSKTLAVDYFLHHSVKEVQSSITDSPKKKLLKLIDTIKLKFPNQNHRFFSLTDHSFLIDSIRKHVEEKKIDMIVMGTKGASGIKKLIIGSNTGAVITRVKCTTLVVPENASYTSPREIAFLTDFSMFYSVKVLEPIFDILERFNSNLRILHIANKEAHLNFDQLKNKEFLSDYLNNRKHSFHFQTNKKIEESIQCFIEKQSISIIAMVAKNLNYFQQILFNSKVKTMSYHTDIPFLVIHEK